MRPEHQAPPEIFYNEIEAKKYSRNTRIQEIQTKMSMRAYELLAIPPEKKGLLLLDIGCGSGLSGDVLTDNGHFWVGVDISLPMLNVAREREVEGDTILQDMGNGLAFRLGVFDGAISISALQWLCVADKKYHKPHKRLTIFFSSLYKCLKRGAKAVFQIYPETPSQMELITSCAMKCGFSGGLVVDYPHSTRAKKYFLCLFAGVPQETVKLPAAITEEQETVKYENKRKTMKPKKGEHRPAFKSKEWILERKERERRKGRIVRPDSKYTGRKRKPKF